MKAKLILGIGIGVGVAVVLAVVGLVTLVGGESQSEPVGQAAAASAPVAAGGAHAATPSAVSTPSQVTINGRALTTQQIADFEKVYRVKPQPGNYWYDSKCGLYGVVGQPAAGFLYAGHELGPLAADASGGNTKVFVNGREQTAGEVQILSLLAQAQVEPGRYWLDAMGNAGYEGNPTPVVNLFAAALAAQQSGASGGGGGGDNFWWTRFSAGNYNSDNSAGYVSLPNGGIVSYGY